MHNPNPKFVRKHGLPPYLETIIQGFDAAATRRNLILDSRKAGFRCRCARVERLDSSIAVLMAIIHTVNLASGYIDRTATAIAYACGLTTPGNKGNTSIARCLRTLYFLRDMGYITFTKGNYLPEEGLCEPLFMRITPKFWELLGVNAQTAAKKQRNALLYVKKKLQGQAFGVDITDWEEAAIERGKELHRIRCEKAAAYNSKRRALAKARAAAKRKADKARNAANRKLRNLVSPEQRNMDFAPIPTVAERKAALIAATLTGEPPNLH